ncbi:unnamed protein product [Rhizoctonia solani]|uniref:Uncharacterized protein n=1 Tax=Rhizoctonia solani TaxID=456999 RepID=A0A8H3DVL5_9AGAM|nr:unnamed protein product [Rhizoctonia solani]
MSCLILPTTIPTATPWKPWQFQTSNLTSIIQFSVRSSTISRILMLDRRCRGMLLLPMRNRNLALCVQLTGSSLLVHVQSHASPGTTSRTYSYCPSSREIHEQSNGRSAMNI